MIPSGRRLAFVTQWFSPEPATVPVWIAHAMSARGWEVKVLTGVPNYPDGVVHEGYRAWRPASEQIGSMGVERVPLFPSHSTSAAARVLNYVSWALATVVFGGRVLKGTDVVLVYSSPATAALAPLLRRRRRGTPYVLMVQDLWPDSIFASGFLRAGLVRRIAEPLVTSFVNATYRFASHIVVISPGMKQTLVERGVPADRVTVIYNWVDESLFQPTAADPWVRRTLGLEHDDFVFMYAGNHGAAQSLSFLVDVFSANRIPPRCHLVLVGDGIEKRALMARARSAGRVHFLPSQPVERMSAIMAAADVQVVSLADEPLFRITMPSKVQSVLACGLPILVVAPGDAAAVASLSGAGLAVCPGDRQGLEEAIAGMAGARTGDLSRLGASASRFYREEMSEEIGSEQLSQILLSFAAGERVGP